MERKSAVGILYKYFGKLPGQTVKEFGEEVKQLTDQDISELGEGIEDGSLNY